MVDRRGQARSGGVALDYVRGMLAFQAGDDTRAREHLERAVQKDPAHTDAMRHYRLLLARKG